MRTSWRGSAQPVSPSPAGRQTGSQLVRWQAPGRNALLQRIQGLFSDEDIVTTDRKRQG